MLPVSTILGRRWAPDTNLDAHTHDFDARGLVTQGDMWLTCDGVTRRLSEGDTCPVARLAPHSERYGPQGVTRWAARWGVR